MLITISDIIANSFRFYTKNFKALLPYILVFFVAFSAKTISAIGTDMLDRLTPFSALVTDVIAIIIILFIFLIVMLTNFALTKTIKNLLGGEIITGLKERLFAAKKYLLTSLAVAILVALILGLGGMLFVIPGVVFFVWYYFAVTSVIIDDKKGIDALRFSKTLSVGRWWAIFFRIIVPKFVFAILILIIMKIVLVFVNLIPHYSLMVAVFVDYAITALSIPLLMAPDIILYENAKAVKTI